MKILRKFLGKKFFLFFCGYDGVPTVGAPPQRVGKISQFVIDNLSMTEGDAKFKQENRKFSPLFLCFT